MNTFRNIIISLFSVIIIMFFFSKSYPYFSADKRTVLVLTYHLISESAQDISDFCITPQMFEEDLKYLKSQGYKFVTASQLYKADTRDKKLVMITFDDGYKSDLIYAVPILEKYDAKATFFIYGKAVDTKGYMTSKELKILSTKTCAEIGNHSFGFHSYGYDNLKKIYENITVGKVINDFEKNSKFLEKITGKKPTSLSYPNGVYTDTVDKLLKKSGIITFSTEETLFEEIGFGPIGRRNRSAYRNIADIEQINLLQADGY